VPTISETDRDIMEKDVTEEEMRMALQSCKDTTPGVDGIGYEFYKVFWDLWKNLIVQSWKYSLDLGTLPDGNRTSIITLLPKEGKDFKNIANWRPITLTNCDLKIITKLYALRLAKVSDAFIYCNQSAYVPGRSVMDNLRVIKHYAESKTNDVDIAVVSLDAKKAFDSVNHKFIKKTLEKYGFGKKFIHVFETLYRDLRANVLINGWKSELIRITNGVKQGDALSCIIFILCIDPLLRNIEANKAITNVTEEKDGKIFGYTDDINAITIYDREAIQAIFDEYEVLTKLCGLELNADKTEILIAKSTASNGNLLQLPAMQAPLQLAPMGPNTTTPYGGTTKHNQNQPKDKTENTTVRYLERDYVIQAKSSIKICGILMGENSKENISTVIGKMKKQLDMWRMRSLTILGKILVIKTFGLSQLIYVMQCCNFTVNDLKTIDDIVLDFIWKKPGNKRRVERIARYIMVKPINLGGFALPRAKELDESIKLKQYLRSRETGHIISRLQRKWFKDPAPFSSYKGDDPVTNTSARTINDHAKEWLDRAEKEGQKVKWLKGLNAESLRAIVNMSGLPNLYLMCIIRNRETTIGDIMMDYENGNEMARIILRPFKLKYKKIFELIMAEPESQNFVLTDKVQELTLDNKLTVRIIRSCLMSSKYNTLESIVVHKSYVLPIEINLLTALGNIRFLTSTYHRNTYLRILNGDWFTNEKLCKIGKKDNPKCDRCEHSEDREHMLVECKAVKETWENLYWMANKVLGVKLEANIKNVLCLGNNAASRSIMTLSMELIGRLSSKSRPKLNNTALKTIITRVVTNELAKPSKRDRNIWEKWLKFLQNYER
jgi:hypothetical protein